MSDPPPKYHRVYLVLREQLDEGRYALGPPGELASTRVGAIDAKVWVSKEAPVQFH